jgi:hypothetical protein
MLEEALTLQNVKKNLSQSRKDTRVELSQRQVAMGPLMGALNPTLIGKIVELVKSFQTIIFRRMKLTKI